jgi:hypothetical protein
MPRHYTDEEKRLVLDRLIANHGDVPRTVNETGVPMRTLYNWQKDANLPLPKLLPNLPTASDLPPSPVTTGEGSGLGVLPPETTEAFQTLHDKLLVIADTLSNRIVEAIDEAPLNQRMTALSQLIDRIAKLAALLPDADEDDEDDDGKPFKIAFDVVPKEDSDDEENKEETEADTLSTRSTSQPENNSGEYRPF